MPLELSDRESLLKSATTSLNSKVLFWSVLILYAGEISCVFMIVGSFTVFQFTFANVCGRGYEGH